MLRSKGELPARRQSTNVNHRVAMAWARTEDGEARPVRSKQMQPNGVVGCPARERQREGTQRVVTHPRLCRPCADDDGFLTILLDIVPPLWRAQTAGLDPQQLVEQVGWGLQDLCVVCQMRTGFLTPGGSPSAQAALGTPARHPTNRNTASSPTLPRSCWHS